jgi:hypothetical protein
MPGVADDDYDDIADAKEARNKIVKSIGGFVKSAVKRSAAKIADALTDSALAPGTVSQPDAHTGVLAGLASPSFVGGG